MANKASRVGIGMKLDAREVDEVVIGHRRGETKADLARRFKVSSSTITRTINHFEFDVARQLGACARCNKGWPATGITAHEQGCSVAYRWGERSNGTSGLAAEERS